MLSQAKYTQSTSVKSDVMYFGMMLKHFKAAESADDNDTAHHIACPSSGMAPCHDRVNKGFVSTLMRHYYSMLINTQCNYISSVSGIINNLILMYIVTIWSQINLEFILLPPLTKLIKCGQSMHAKQCHGGGIAGRFTDTVTILGELAAQCIPLTFYFLPWCIIILSLWKENRAQFMNMMNSSI